MSRGYCLAQPGTIYVIYLPDGGATDVNLAGLPSGTMQVSWFDPRTGVTVDGGKLETRGRRKLGPGAV
ncbi:MAG: putative collagen-binding domain-containing protein [Limisphaerales bacterium]